MHLTYGVASNFSRAIRHSFRLALKNYISIGTFYLGGKKFRTIISKFYLLGKNFLWPKIPPYPARPINIIYFQLVI